LHEAILEKESLLFTLRRQDIGALIAGRDKLKGRRKMPVIQEKLLTLSPNPSQRNEAQPGEQQEADDDHGDYYQQHDQAGMHALARGLDGSLVLQRLGRRGHGC